MHDYKSLCAAVTIRFTLEQRCPHRDRRHFDQLI